MATAAKSTLPMLIKAQPTGFESEVLGSERTSDNVNIFHFSSLAANSESFNQALISFEILVSQVIQMSLSGTDHFQKTTS